MAQTPNAQAAANLITRPVLQIAQLKAEPATSVIDSTTLEINACQHQQEAEVTEETLVEEVEAEVTTNTRTTEANQHTEAEDFVEANKTAVVATTIIKK